MFKSSHLKCQHEDPVPDGPEAVAVDVAAFSVVVGGHAGHGVGGCVGDDPVAG